MTHEEDLKQKKKASLVRYHTINIISKDSLPSPQHSKPKPQPPQRAKIIVGFPGVGKSFVSREQSSQYSWLNIYDEPGYAKGDEKRFLAGVLKLAQEPGVLLLPSHRMTGEFLISNDLVFTSVFPKRGLKEDYIRRYRERGSSEAFVELVSKNWDPFVDAMWYQHGKCNHIELDEGQYLKDVFAGILTQADATGPASML